MAREHEFQSLIHRIIYILQVKPIIFVHNMSKRTFKSDEVLAKTSKKPKGHWSLGLLASMKDPKSIYKDTENIVVIHDKYPKAKIHFLVLPREEISSIFKLNKSHIELLEEFGSMFNTIKEDYGDLKLQAGFHAIPSMQRLHMHVISADMNSECLKTKVHWNSFTTNFFIPYSELLEILKKDGVIQRISSDKHKLLMSQPLKCNQCEFEPKNMPQLKQHLLNHLNT